MDTEEVLAVVQLERRYALLLREEIVDIVVLSEDVQPFQVYLGHIVFHDIGIGPDGHETIRSSEEQGTRLLVLMESTVAELGDGQTVFAVIGLSGMGLGIESYQPLVGAYPEIALLVFQNPVYSIVQEQVGLVVIMRVVPVEVEQSRTCAQPISFLILIDRENVVDRLAVHHVVETVWSQAAGPGVQLVGSVAPVAEPQDGVVFPEGGEEVIGSHTPVVQCDPVGGLDGRGGTVSVQRDFHDAFSHGGHP